MGRTYHESNRSPGKLPLTRTRTTIRSKTYKGDGFNELRFEDMAGREEVYIHAQKDMNHVINNDRTSLTKRHSVDKIQGNSAVLVDESQVTQIGGTQNTCIGGDYVLSVGNNFTDGYHKMNFAAFQDNAATLLKQMAFSIGASKEICGGVKIIQAAEGVEIYAGNVSLILKHDCQVDIKGTKLTIEGSEEILIKSVKANIEAK